MDDLYHIFSEIDHDHKETCRHCADAQQAAQEARKDMDRDEPDLVKQWRVTALVRLLESLPEEQVAKIMRSYASGKMPKCEHGISAYLYCSDCE